jgi:signal transduction histidine kinase/CheY-like chemotaxis protein
VGWEAEAVFDGRKAIEILSTDVRFDAVLLDRSMAGISGDDVLRWIRLDAVKDQVLRPNLQHLCVVMLTAYGEVESAVEALNLGAFQYLQKPITNPAYLRSVLSAGVAWHRAHAVRHELLLTRNRDQLFETVRSILKDAVQPEKVHIVFVGEDGSIEEIVGETMPTELHSTPKFVLRLMSGEQLVFEQQNTDVERLEPILPQAKTLMAVPVPGSTRHMVGVLDMESTIEHAFDLSWSQVLSYLADMIGISEEIEAQTKERVRVERERNKIEAEKNVEREKVKQIGFLYREFRHSVATNAQIVSMQARELLSGDVNAPADEVKLRQRLKFIQENAEIIEGVVQDIKTISVDPQRPKLEIVDLQAVVRESIETFRLQLSSARIGVQIENFSSSAEVLADRANIVYCLKCLIQNSVEAVEEMRRTRVEPSRHDDRIALEVYDQADGVRIVVRDSGVGFDLSGQELFQPLFSTKTKRPMSGARQDITGAERVAQLLELAGSWAPRRLDAAHIENIRKGVDILIRDGEAVDIYVRQGPAGDDVTLSEFMKSASERLFTSQPLGGDWRDRGIGLYSVRRIVEEMHGGRITAFSEGFGKGASFTMVLPKAM